LRQESVFRYSFETPASRLEWALSIHVETG
jgi:hypothetical protein